MPTSYKVLGQAAPGATTDTTLYTVPAATQTVVSTIVVANRATSSATYRVAIRPEAATLANQHYLAFDVTVGAADSTTLTLGITLNATDVITVRASTANLSFNAFGSEITA
jgi:glucose-6-phosphate dehydrogenase assembly protein OpcA